MSLRCTLFLLVIILLIFSYLLICFVKFISYRTDIHVNLTRWSRLKATLIKEPIKSVKKFVSYLLRVIISDIYTDKKIRKKISKRRTFPILLLKNFFLINQSINETFAWEKYIKNKILNLNHYYSIN